MILPDTNVISEAMRMNGNATVTAWLSSQPLAGLFLAAPVLAELLLGIQILPAGKRKTDLRAAFARTIDQRFRDRMLPFDHRAAAAYATVVASARSRGQAIAVIDGQIAAIAAAHGFSVATRDTAPFAAAGVPVINPWRFSPA